MVGEIAKNNAKDANVQGRKIMANNIDEKVAELQQELGEIEMGVLTEGYTLADAIREGSTVTEQANGWGNGCETACALTSGWLAMKARGLVD